MTASGVVVGGALGALRGKGYVVAGGERGEGRRRIAGGSGCGG